MSDDRIVRPFADVLRDIRGGDLHHELSEKLGELVDAVHETGQPGKLVLEIAMRPLKTKGRVEVFDRVKVTAPEVRDTSIFFAKRGQLSRRDPDQLAFELDAEGETGGPVLTSADKLGKEGTTDD